MSVLENDVLVVKTAAEEHHKCHSVICDARVHDLLETIPILRFFDMS